MKRILTTLALMLAILLCTAAFALGEGSAEYYLGGPINDFTVTTWDGQTVTLSKLLEEKDMVLINVWATWCGPCQAEFPYMEEAYQQYKDDVAIVALSCEPTDTDDVLAAYVAEMGMSFYVAQDTVDMATLLYAEAIPTTIVVDRNGVICFWHEGSVTDTSSFCRLFDVFVADDYTESQLLLSIPPMKPNVAFTDEAKLAEALGVDNAINPTGEYDWPMTVTEKDGSLVVTSTNGGQGDSTAAVYTKVHAEKGSAIVVTFKTSTERGYDMMQITLNGEVVKSFGGEHNWMTWAIPVEESGDYTLGLSYTKDAAYDEGEDAIYVDSVAVVTGAQASMFLSANPQYPVAEETTLTLSAPNMQEVILNDETGLLAASFGEARYYILNGNTVNVTATISADVDPETAYFYSDYDGSYTYLVDAVNGNAYATTAGVDSLDVTGYPYTGIYLYLDPNGMNVVASLYFMDEENLVTFVDAYALGTWHYADTTPEEPAAPVAPETPALSTYTVYYVDQNGAPVPGVMCQICDATSCQVITSDANGVVTLTTEPYPWEIHTLKVPEGYEGDTRSVTTMPAEGGELTLTVTNLNAPEANPLIGAWKLTDVEGEGIDDTTRAMLALVDMTITFTADEMSIVQSVYGMSETETYGYTWQGSQIVDSDGYAYDIAVDGDTLRLSMEGQTMVLTRVAAETATEETAPETAPAGEATLLGAWQLSDMSGDEEAASYMALIQALGGMIEIVFTETEMTYNISLMGQTETETSGYTIEDNRIYDDSGDYMEFAFIAGQLVLTQGGISMTMSRVGEAPAPAADSVAAVDSAPVADAPVAVTPALLVGNWKLSTVEGSDEVASTMSLVTSMGGSVTFTFTETQMTLAMSFMGQTETDTVSYYIEDGMMYSNDGAVVELTYNGTELRMSAEGMTLVLTR